MTPSQNQKDQALFRLLYDLSVLATALEFLRGWKRKPRREDLGEEQFALNALLVKERLLYDFFCNAPRRSDITADQLIPGTVLQCSPEDAAFRICINKWCAHMTWDRVDHLITNGPPTRRVAARFGKRLLAHAVPFVDECLKRGFTLNKTGKAYWVTLHPSATAAAGNSGSLPV